mmetsp:Transcript_27879/g.65528  ORF Transcript_27879/g.65528 Transcript_27879/m.65528 type:complete len:333 (-) Transcript_27879:145-1143(-)
MTLQNVVTSTMVSQNVSIEGAYDEAIEDAASRIYEASRPQRIIASNSSDSNTSSQVSNVDEIVKDEKSSIALSPLINDDDNSEEIYALVGHKRMSTSISDNYTYDGDIESDILYLEEKKRILKKAKVRNEKEEAYIAINARDISNRKEFCSRRFRSSEIWAEARRIVKKYKLSGEAGSRSDEDEANLPDLISSTIGDAERQGSTSPHSAPEFCSPIVPSSSPSVEKDEYDISSTRKRTRIDLSTVKQVTSTEFARESFVNEEDPTEAVGEHDHSCVTERRVPQRNHILNASNWKQVREMLLATDSRNWISEAALKQILVLSSTAIAEHHHWE